MSDFATWSDLEALKRNLEFTKDDLLRKAGASRQRTKTSSRARDEIAAELERMSLLSEDIGKRMKAQELASTAQDLARSQERLMESLDKLQSGDKNLDAIMKQIAELAKTLTDLQQALSQLAQQMPDDFMNAETMQGLGFDDMFTRARRDPQKTRRPGDIEGARQMARELFNQMAQMVAAMQNAAALGDGLEHGAHAGRNAAPDATSFKRSLASSRKFWSRPKASITPRSPSAMPR